MGYVLWRKKTENSGVVPIDISFFLFENKGRKKTGILFNLFGVLLGISPIFAARFSQTG
jgi:hypothetical protein